MEKQIIQSSALDLLKNLIATAPEKVKEIIDKNEKINIEGPTYAEYLVSLDEYSILTQCSIDSGIELEYMREEPYYQIPSEFYEVEVIPPPILSSKNKKIKKDSVILQSLFFYLLLYYVRSKKSRIQIC